MPFPVVPAKAGTQGFQSLVPGSPHAPGRRVCPSGGYSESRLRWNDDNKSRGTMSSPGARRNDHQGQPQGPQSHASSFMIAVIWASLASC